MRKQQGKVWDVTEHPRKHHDGIPPPAPPRAPKPVDEDLYKIPPELLRRTKRVRLRFHHHHFASFCCFVTLFTCYLSMLINFFLVNFLSMLINFFEFVLICRRKCWVSFPSVWYLLLAFHEQWCVLESEDIQFFEEQGRKDKCPCDMFFDFLSNAATSAGYVFCWFFGALSQMLNYPFFYAEK